MHRYPLAGLLRSSISTNNALYGLMLTMAALDIRHSSLHSIEMTVQVSICLGLYSMKRHSQVAELEEVDGTSQGYPVLGVEACGTEHNSSAAWIEVEQRGRVTFFNKQGDKSTCVLNNGLKLGSRCNVSDLASSTKKSSALATPTTLSPASKLASTYFQTTATSGCSAA